MSLLETGWVTVCWDLLAAPSLPPGWRGGRRGREQSCEVFPLLHAEEGSVPLQGHRWTLQLLHPSPGTVGWRQKDHHQPRMSLNPPAAQQHEQRDRLGGILSFLGICCPSAKSSPRSCPPSPVRDPTHYQKAAPASGGPEEGVAPFPHIDQAPLRHSTARLHHLLLGLENPRLALGECRG